MGPFLIRAQTSTQVFLIEKFKIFHWVLIDRADGSFKEMLEGSGVDQILKHLAYCLLDLDNERALTMAFV